MNVHITRNNRPNNPSILSVENREQLISEEKTFKSQYASKFSTGFDCICTQEVYEELKNTAGTPEAPVLIDYPSLSNFSFPEKKIYYIENEELKIINQN